MNEAAESSTRQWLATLTPLLQTLLWVVAVVVVMVVFRREIDQFRGALRTRLSGGAAVKFGPMELGELVHRVESVKDEVQTLAERVSRAFLLSMSEPMYHNLRKLTSGEFGAFENSAGLERELRHLRDVGYVTIPSVRSIPASGANLSDFVTVTSNGRDFVSLREELANTGGSA
jgi:hypothetical protein